MLDYRARLSEGLRGRRWRRSWLESAHLTRACIAAHFVNTKQIVFVLLVLLQSNSVFYLILLMLGDAVRWRYAYAKPQAVGWFRFGRQRGLDEAKIDGAEAQIIQNGVSKYDGFISTMSWIVKKAEFQFDQKTLQRFAKKDFQTCNDAYLSRGFITSWWPTVSLFVSKKNPSTRGRWRKIRASESPIISALLANSLERPLPRVRGSTQK